MQGLRDTQLEVAKLSNEDLICGLQMEGVVKLILNNISIV